MDVTTFEDKEVVAIMNKYFYAIKFNAEGKDTILYNGKTYTNMNPTNARGTHQLAVELLNGKLGIPYFSILRRANEIIATHTRLYGCKII